MAHLLVTGGAGFAGSSFVRQVLDTTEHAVTVLDKLTYAGSAASLDAFRPARVELIVGDVTDVALVDHLVAGADTVVHFAAETHNDTSLVDPRPFVETNVLGTFTVLEAVRRHGKRLHHVSTDEVFGDLPLDTRDVFSEGSPYNPSTPYSSSKGAADLLVRAWVRSFGVAATISISSNMYGPYQHVEKFIPRQITNVLRGERPKVYGEGRNIRDWIHVDDHSSAVAAIVERGEIGRTYAVGADNQRSNRSVVALLLQLMGRPVNAFDQVGDRPGHDARYAIDAGRLRAELGWAPRHTDFERGLTETIEWYVEHETWWAPMKDAAESTYAARGQ